MKGASAVCCLLLVCFLLGLLFEPEDGGSTLLRNISKIYQVTSRHILEESTLQHGKWLKTVSSGGIWCSVVTYLVIWWLEGRVDG
jgi:hypothetical protein